MARRQSAPFLIEEVATTKAKRKWSQELTEHGDAMDLKESVFKSDDPKKIAASIKHFGWRAAAENRAPFARPCRC
jgi:hypothetical protein